MTDQTLITQLCEYAGLDRNVKRATAKNAELAADIIASGAGYVLPWLKDFVQADQLGKVSQFAIDQLAKAEPADIIADLETRLAQETSWLIPTNSDTMAAVYRLQALQRVANDLRGALEYVTERNPAQTEGN